MCGIRALAPAALAVVFGCTGCYNAKIRTAARPDGQKHTDTGVSAFWGATNTTTEAIECPHGLAYAETYHPWWGNFIVAPLTIGIIVPIRKVWICAAPPAVAPAAPAAPQVIVVQPAAPVVVQPAAPSR